jgi:hypothetical protein
VRVGDVGELVEQQLEVRAASLRCPAQYAEKTPGGAEDVDADARVVGEPAAPCAPRRARLDERVLGEGHAVLDGSGPS